MSGPEPAGDPVEEALEPLIQAMIERGACDCTWDVVDGPDGLHEAIVKRDSDCPLHNLLAALAPESAAPPGAKPPNQERFIGHEEDARELSRKAPIEEGERDA